MVHRLFKKAPIRVWAIKQVDTATLHLCGPGTLETNLKHRMALEALRCGQYHDAVRIGNSGTVLNARLLAAVVPLGDLRLVDDDNCAEWRGRVWSVSHVPQRAWVFDRPLVAEPNPTDGLPALISREDVSHIRRNIRQDATPSWKVSFRPMDTLEDSNRDLDAAIEEAQRRRRIVHKGWREDGSWGPLDENKK